MVRYDIASEEPVRGPDGLCITCAADEVGEVVGEILSDPKKPGNRFEGYTDRDATVRKVLSDVVKPGDRWFRTGDLMRRDALGYFYFVDRIGDTFRWKGENVSTMEVAEALTYYPGVAEATVYGVSVPGAEGRAGMAALVPEAGAEARPRRPEGLPRGPAARLCGPGLPAASARSRCDRHLQAAQGGSRGRTDSIPAASPIRSS